MRKFLFLIALIFAANVSAQVTTAFTYQGELAQSEAPANGSFDFQFVLYDAPSGGVAFAGPITVDDVLVDEGVFWTPVDFGMDLFGIMDLWLEVRVRDGGSTGVFTVLAPRQLITPVPLALHAQNVEPGAVGSQQIATDSVGAREADSSEIQFRIDDQCGVGSAIRLVGPDGSVACEATSGLSLPFFGSVNTRNPAFEIQNAGTGEGMRVSGAGGDGIDISGAGGNGIDITGATNAGINVRASTDQRAAIFSGNDDRRDISGAIVEISNSGAGNALLVSGAGDEGIVVDNIGGNGLLIFDAGEPAIWIENASDDGINIPAAGDDALEVSAIQHGIIANGDVDGDGNGLAGIFNGDVLVNGTMSKASGAFKIDHPLDPSGKYLQHSFVESPDMMNVYNGNVTLDAAGRATVELPEYFEALNREFRFQLTPIGGAAPNLHIAAEIQDNRFDIAGGGPGMKVSWQVTGVRQDAWAKENRIAVEVDKPKAKRGTYLHPQVHEQPASKAEGLLEMGEDHREAIQKARAERGEVLQ